MRKTVYRLKKFRLSEISLVDRPACGIAMVERIELVKRNRSPELEHQFNQPPAQENSVMTSEELNALPDSAFAYIEPGGSKDATGRTVPRSLRHFPIHDAAHVRNALARVKESKFGAEALPSILEAAKKFGIHSEFESPQHTTKADLPYPFGELHPSGSVDPAAGFIADDVTGHYPPGNFIAGDPGVAGSPALHGEANAIEGEYPDLLAPGEICKFVPSDAMPIAEGADFRTDATSLSAAITQAATNASLGQICDLMMMVAGNIVRASGIQNKKAAILAVGDEFKSALARLVDAPGMAKRLGPSRWRERSIGIEHAMRTATRKRALVKALEQMNFAWPQDAVAVRLLGKGDRFIGWLSRSDFLKRGAVLSAASRDRIHQARDILIGMCAGSGCGQDRALNAYIDQQADQPLSEVSDQMTTPQVTNGVDPTAEMGKLLDNLRHATRSLNSVADEVRKVAEASAGSIRKSESSAKVLSTLAERIARLEAQPDNSRPQPLRAVEKATPIALAGNSTDDTRLRIAELQSQAAELRKRGDDAVAQKRLSEIGVEIIRLSNGLSQPVF
ncbi:MAG: hypothetical protein ABSD31_15515 [Candidatus Binataceae bacterium]|jgi:hypothetical protein